MQQIVADIEALIADIETAVSELEAKGKAEAAVVLRMISAQFAAIVAELKKLLGGL